MDNTCSDNTDSKSHKCKPSFCSSRSPRSPPPSGPRAAVFLTKSDDLQCGDAALPAVSDQEGPGLQGLQVQEDEERQRQDGGREARLLRGLRRRRRRDDVETKGMVWKEWSGSRRAPSSAKPWGARPPRAGSPSAHLEQDL